MTTAIARQAQKVYHAAHTAADRDPHNTLVFLTAELAALVGDREDAQPIIMAVSRAINAATKPRAPEHAAS